LDEAVALALATDRAPLIFSDAGDNPGGGGSGRTTELLRALVEAGAEGVLYGSIFEPGLAAAAHESGIGAMINARFNAETGTVFDVPFEAPAEVLALGDGAVTGRLGLYAGRRLQLGPTAVCARAEMTSSAFSICWRSACSAFSLRWTLWSSTFSGRSAWCRCIC
ncbi:MAG: MlrC C-terminal domain-containing protein, partial [Caldilinea sp.]